VSRASRVTRPSQRRAVRGSILASVLLVALAATGRCASAAPPAGSVPATVPDLTKAVAYLVDPVRLIAGHYYEGFAGSGFADYSLTLDGAFALAATSADATALRGLADFIGTRGKDGAGRTVDAWTGIGTPYASGGSLGKEVLLAEVMGADPHTFGGHDLVAALDAAVCTKVSVTPDASCPAVGSYRYSPSVFAQGLGIIGQVRAGSAAGAAGAPVAYLESLQHADGSWPSLIPSTGDSDVDSTAMAVMALALVPGSQSAQAVARGLRWIAAQQEPDGGFPGAAGDSTNSAALAAQALGLAAGTYSGPLAHARAFLAAEQNPDGGFDVAVGSAQGSDLRASTQAVSGAVGTSIGVLTVPATSPSPSATATPSGSGTPSPTVSGSVSASASVSGSLSVAATAATADPSLPATGARAAGPALAGALLVASGLALVLAARRSAALRRH
jgi:Prenyltransferase and squalene oxidase repeat